MKHRGDDVVQVGYVRHDASLRDHRREEARKLLPPAPAPEQRIVPVSLEQRGPALDFSAGLANLEEHGERVSSHYIERRIHFLTLRT